MIEQQGSHESGATWIALMHMINMRFGILEENFTICHSDGNRFWYDVATRQSTWRQALAYIITDFLHITQSFTALLPPFYVILKNVRDANSLALGLLGRLASNASRDDADSFRSARPFRRHLLQDAVYKPRTVCCLANRQFTHLQECSGL